MRIAEAQSAPADVKITSGDEPGGLARGSGETRSSAVEAAE